MTPPTEKNAPPRSGLPLRFFLDTKSTFGIPQFQGLEETGTKSSKGWKDTTFGAVVENVPITHKKLPKGEYLETGLYPVVDQGQQYIGGYSNDDSKVISEDLPVLVFGDHTRAFKYLDQPFVPGADGIKVLKPIGVNAKWLYQIAHVLEFPNKGYARHYQHLKSARIFIPPLDEQKQIVAEIEKQFTRLEAGVSALKRVQANLKRYRAAVLKAACEGKLVPTEAELHKSGSGVSPLNQSRDGSATLPFETGAQLLTRILEERRKNWSGRGKYKEPAAPDTANLPPLPEGWTWANVGQLGEIKGGKRLPLGHHYSPIPTAFPYIRVADFDNYGVRQDDLKFLHEETQKEIHRYTISKNDIYISIAGSIGVVGVVPDNLDGANLTENAAKITSLTFVEQKYICFWLSSNTGRSFIADKTIATTQPKLALFRIEVIPIPLPPLAEQTRIVAEAERRLSVVEELETVVFANLQRATRLRQAILQRAFSGELI